jgi:hypothetical protein
MKGSWLVAGVALAASAAYFGYFHFASGRSALKRSAVEPRVEAASGRAKGESTELANVAANTGQPSLDARVSASVVPDADSSSALVERSERPWLDAKQELLEQFMPSPRQKGDFRSLQLICRANISLIGGIAEAEFDLDSDLRAQSMQYLRLALNGAEPEARMVDELEAAAAKMLSRLEPMIETASDMLEESLWHYWREGDYVYWPHGQEAEFPGGFEAYSRGEGALLISYPAIVHGWRAYLAFDSADYPALESLLRDIGALKTQFMLQIEGIVRGG